VAFWDNFQASFFLQSVNKIIQVNTEFDGLLFGGEG
jgi:hypothetical protein